MSKQIRVIPALMCGPVVCYLVGAFAAWIFNPAAQALRWWLHAQADEEVGIGGGLCLETRIVSHRISYSHKIETVAAHEHIHGEDRSNCIPDWGKAHNV